MTTPVNTASAASAASAALTFTQLSGEAGGAVVAAPDGPPTSTTEAASRQAASRRRTADFTDPSQQIGQVADQPGSRYSRSPR